MSLLPCRKGLTFIFLQDLSKKVEVWMEKYETDVEDKQRELDILKASKAKDLERLQDLTKLVVNDYSVDLVYCLFGSKFNLAWLYLHLTLL